MITNPKFDDRQRDVDIKEPRRPDDDERINRTIWARAFVKIIRDASRRAKIEDRLNADNDKHNEFRWQNPIEDSVSVPAFPIAN